MSEHPSPERLEELVQGVLGRREREATIEHLGECEVCMQVADGLWLGARAIDEEMPSMGDESRSKIEDQLFRRIRVAAVGNELAWLATGGFLNTILALLRPLLILEEASESSRGSVR